MMKKRFLYTLSLAVSIIVATVTMIGLTGCQKKGINGDLDGMWQIMEVAHTESDGTVTTFVPDQKYLAIQLHVCQLRSQGGVTGPAANITFDGKILTMDFPEKENAPFWDIVPEWGIYDPQTTFTITTLTSSRLVMHSDVATLTCRKF